MTTLLIRLAGPMQAWGASSRFSRRDTRQEPTKSGVLGLIAAAQGMRRTDGLEHLAALPFGVRVDQAGVLIRDYQTAMTPDGTKPSDRYYLGDAVFVAGIEGDPTVIKEIVAALRNPAFPLYLGRRSCPPSQPLPIAVTEDRLLAALRECPWQAATWYRKKQPKTVQLRMAIDGCSFDEGELVRDVPVSFNPELRQYEWRTVVEEYVETPNPEGAADRHDPMAALEGA
ncbi:CRISPR-associated protein Cas5 (plasmid) [Mycobacterium sp. JS623]|uniref:type I-E CRISPR-associated protein Cas5/CasD n=1 Tax=Mycobacterium sp. JS623 TaxID=212767 RepID=UPI0002A56DD7|nr:type I-E CRISPR-associated protein Cas5/CasD [Mycobacterium sp. JS623]AGB27115.1 CRISPR-associated protein Cas5 [Mycobacterium sp. JS623]